MSIGPTENIRTRAFASSLNLWAAKSPTSNRDGSWRNNGKTPVAATAEDLRDIRQFIQYSLEAEEAVAEKLFDLDFSNNIRAQAIEEMKLVTRFTDPATLTHPELRYKTDLELGIEAPANNGDDLDEQLL